VEPGQAPRARSGLAAKGWSLALLAQWRAGSWPLLIEGVGPTQCSTPAGLKPSRASVCSDRPLEGWELEPGTGPTYDPTATACRWACGLLHRSCGQSASSPAQARPDSMPPDLELTLLGKLGEAGALAGGGLIRLTGSPPGAVPQGQGTQE